MNGITMDQWLKMVPDSVVNLPEGLRNLLFQLYQTFIAADRWKWFLNGLKITFAVTIGALILGVIIGLLIAVVRTAHDSRRMGKSNIILSILNAVCKLYLTVIRGTPMMVQLLIMGFVIMVPKDCVRSELRSICRRDRARRPDVGQSGSDGGRTFARPELCTDHAPDRHSAGNQEHSSGTRQ